jgi:DNA polymerase elongation subunit (family B)
MVNRKNQLARALCSSVISRLRKTESVSSALKGKSNTFLLFQELENDVLIRITFISKFYKFIFSFLGNLDTSQHLLFRFHNFYRYYRYVYIFFYLNNSIDTIESIGEYKMKEIIFDIETTTLEPFSKDSRVVAIGVKCGNYNEVLMSTQEKQLLEKFWDLPFFKDYFKLIGFNSFVFDIPYLIVRSFKYGIRIPDIKGKTIDLRFVLSYGNKWAKGKLEDYSKLILGDRGCKLKDCDGSKVKELWEQGECDKLKKYCNQDVFLTERIYERLKVMGVL